MSLWTNSSIITIMSAPQSLMTGISSSYCETVGGKSHKAAKIDPGRQNHTSQQAQANIIEQIPQPE